MLIWLKRLKCKHEIGIFTVDGGYVNACKHCKKKMELYK